MPCSSCVDKIQENLIQNGILKSNIHISYETGTVIVNTDQPSSLISNYIEKTGMKAVLKGYGSATSRTILLFNLYYSNNNVFCFIEVTKTWALLLLY